MEEFFKTQSQEEIDRQWLTQLCWDGQMADDEIEEFVDAVVKWKDNKLNEFIKSITLKKKKNEIFLLPVIDAETLTPKQ